MNPSLGLKAFADGFALARHPKLLPYVWLPTGLSLAIILIGLYFGLGYLTTLTDDMVASLPEWLGWLELVVTPLLYFLGILAGAWSFAFLAVLIASPFLGVFSLALERIRFGSAPETTTGLWTDVARSIAREVRKLVYYVPRLVVVFLLTLIPVVNLAAPI
ncbi:MAG: EI24 domain-containing protein, partial [Gammaproteobacteria bacterium]